MSTKSGYAIYAIGLLFGIAFLFSAFLYNENQNYRHAIDTYEQIAKYNSEAGLELGVILGHMRYGKFDEALAAFPQFKESSEKTGEQATILFSQVHFDQQYLMDSEKSSQANGLIVSGLEKFIKVGRDIQFASNPTKVELSEIRNQIESAKSDFEAAKEPLKKIVDKERHGVEGTENSIQFLISSCDNAISQIQVALES